MKESKIQKEIQVAASPYACLFRIDAGMFYQGKGVVNTPEYGRVLLAPKAVKVAVKGYPDLSGWKRDTGQYVAFEVKTDEGKVRPEQEHFLARVREDGGIAAVVRSAEEAKEVLISE